jgi:hypothetical protein
VLSRFREHSWWTETFVPDKHSTYYRTEPDRSSLVVGTVLVREQCAGVLSWGWNQLSVFAHLNTAFAMFVVYMINLAESWTLSEQTGFHIFQHLRRISVFSFDRFLQHAANFYAPLYIHFIS